MNEEIFRIDIFKRENEDSFVILVWDFENTLIHNHIANLNDFRWDYYFSFFYEDVFFDLITYDTGDLLAVRIESSNDDTIIGFSCLPDIYKKREPVTPFENRPE